MGRNDRFSYTTPKFTTSSYNQEVSGRNISPEGVKRKLNGVVDDIPPDEEYEILGGEPTDDEWGSDESENETDDETSDTEQLSNTQVTDVADNECTSVDPEVEADLVCLSRIEVVSMEKKESSDNLLLFFIKTDNASCKERQRCRESERERERKEEATNSRGIPK